VNGNFSDLDPVFYVWQSIGANYEAGQVYRFGMDFERATFHNDPCEVGVWLYYGDDFASATVVTSKFFTLTSQGQYTSIMTDPVTMSAGDPAVGENMVVAISFDNASAPGSGTGANRYAQTAADNANLIVGLANGDFEYPVDSGAGGDALTYWTLEAGSGGGIYDIVGDLSANGITEPPMTSQVYYNNVVGPQTMAQSAGEFQAGLIYDLSVTFQKSGVHPSNNTYIWVELRYGADYATSTLLTTEDSVLVGAGATETLSISTGVLAAGAPAVGENIIVAFRLNGANQTLGASCAVDNVILTARPPQGTTILIK
jgi:hypothetical protein